MKIPVEKDIELIAVDKSHAEVLFQLVDTNRKYLRQWLPWVDDNQAVRDTFDYIEREEKKRSRNVGISFSILFQNKIIGQISINSINNVNKIAEIGYWVNPEYQGRGIMTKCSKALIDYCFNQLYLNRVEIKCGIENKKSRAIPERLNFTKEGIIRQGEFLNDRFIDLVLYSKLKSEIV